MSAFNQLLQFAMNSKYQPIDFLYRAKTRNEISDRLLSWAQLFQKNKFSIETSFLIASIIGEIANNAFDTI